MLKFIALLLLLTLLPSQTYSCDTFKKAIAHKEADIAVFYRHGEPMAYEDTDKKMKGIEAEILKHFIHFIESKYKIKFEVEWVRFDSFSKFYKSVKGSNGGVFGIGSVSIKESRKKDLKFSPAYIDNFPVMLSHKSFNKLTDIKNIATDFKGKKAIIVEGTTHEQRIREIRKKYFPSLVIERKDSYAEVIETIEKSNGEYFTSLDLVKSWPMIKGKNFIRHEAGDGKIGNYGIIMPINSDWQPLFDEFFRHGKGYRSSSSYISVIRKHYGQEFVNILQMLKKRKKSG